MSNQSVYREQSPSYQYMWAFANLNILLCVLFTQSNINHADNRTSVTPGTRLCLSVSDKYSNNKSIWMFYPLLSTEHHTRKYHPIDMCEIQQKNIVIQCRTLSARSRFDYVWSNIKTGQMGQCKRLNHTTVTPTHTHTRKKTNTYN